MPRSAPPAAPRHPHVTERHGDRRVDDYFWLRERDNPEVKAYLEAENAYAEQMLASLGPLREQLYDEMLARIKQTDLSVPVRRGSYWYYTRTEEGRQYPIHCRKPVNSEAEEVLLDVNQLAEGQPFMAIGAFTVSDDEHLLAYTTDTTGFRDYSLFVKDLRTGALLPDRAQRVASVAWAADNRTLFYTIEDEAKRPHQLHRHVLGEAGSVLVFEEPDDAFRVAVARTRSKDFLLLYSASHTTSEARCVPATEPAGAWHLILPRRQDIEYDVEHRADRFVLRINDTGRNFRVVSVPVHAPAKVHAWHEILPHRDDVMVEGVDLFAGYSVVEEREDGLPQMRVTDLGSGTWHRIEFPESVFDAYPAQNPEWETTRFRFGYESFVTPASVFEYDLATHERVLLKETEVLGGYDRTRYVTERIHAPAADGTPIPVSLVYRSGIPRDGTAPLLLEGYGAYGIPESAGFSSTRLSLLDRGVVFAVAHIRGGGDLGKPWHDQGRMARKINTFTDFIAAAQQLIDRGYTRPERLGIIGGSAGGLLVAAVTNMRPDLLRCVVALVPFVDVINTMSDESLPLTVGEYEEWGNPGNEADYRVMIGYSPYENLAARDYPAMLVRTSFNDSQVMYWEPAKYVARLRTLKTDRNPLLLVTNMGAGHGGASGRYDRLRELALDYGFVLSALGVVDARIPEEEARHETADSAGGGAGRMRGQQPAQ